MRGFHKRRDDYGEYCDSYNYGGYNIEEVLKLWELRTNLELETMEDKDKFLELCASYVILIGNVMVNTFTCNLAFDIDHMLKCSSPCDYLEKQLLEFMWLLYCGKKMNGSFKVLKVHPCDLVETTFEYGVFELTLKHLDKKLVYPISFIDYLLKSDILKEFLVQETTYCVKLLNQSFGGILLYYLIIREFFDELISLLYCKEVLGGLSPLKEMGYQIEWVTE
ncbi:hypothetical protein M9H77_16668 [Catharanthus roseus]|uniref:Uncharacterized protein n=1 Tax=Catharanthus roseus TaxID=4058 RepID=A0ACC0B2D5_CATRO|nr:hypothetical protein M9H77_16668 [Catharanthus roseus]